MAKPDVGEMLLHDYILPPLLAGRYRLEIDTEVKIDAAAQPLENRFGHFDVDAPRFTLAPHEVAGVFPPKNGHGPFDEAIPHVALGRRTLPWERIFASGKETFEGVPIPWMALLMFEDGECTIEVKQKIGDKLPADVVARLAVPGDLLVDTVTAPRSLVVDLMPSYAELGLLTHVREVNVDDRELSAGDSDGFFAVVMGNRVPQRGKKYRCCLVSIEQRTDLVPERPPERGTGGIDLFDHLSDIAVANAFELASAPGTVRASSRIPPGILGGGAVDDRIVTFDPPREREGDVRTSTLDKSRFVAGRIKSPHAIIQDASLIVLTTWVFECEGIASFRALMQTLDVGMIGKPHDGGPEMTDTGHLRLDLINRAGAPETVFFRGPLVPAPLSRDPNGPYHSADQARRVAPDVGAEDVSYACAFEVGRLIAAADARLAQELMRWRRGAYRRAVRLDHMLVIKALVRITDLIDDRLSLAALFAVRSVARMAAGAGPLADPFDLVKLRRAPGFDSTLLQQTFSLPSADEARALLGTGAVLLQSEVPAPAFELPPTETIDSVLRDTDGLHRLQQTRDLLLENVRIQLEEFGRIER
jgi:hypothetical protein